MPEATSTSSNSTSEAIKALRAGHCAECGKIREERKMETSAGFGQGMKHQTIFVCGNPGCQNFGKP